MQEDYRRIMELKIPRKIEVVLFKLYFFGLLNDKALIKEFKALKQKSILKFSKDSSLELSLRKQAVKFVVKKSRLINIVNIRYLIDLINVYHDSNGSIKVEDWNKLVTETYRKNPLRWGFSSKNSEKFMREILDRLVLC
jgi:hypothetical protein